VSRAVFEVALNVVFNEAYRYCGGRRSAAQLVLSKGHSKVPQLGRGGADVIVVYMHLKGPLLERLLGYSVTHARLKVVRRSVCFPVDRGTFVGYEGAFAIGSRSNSVAGEKPLLQPFWSL
jgi:hypothetical protein